MNLAGVKKLNATIIVHLKIGLTFVWFEYMGIVEKWKLLRWHHVFLHDAKATLRCQL